ncbi:hypothetical protein [Limnoglobus roseus]|uniref:Uncharacterized protein n=1 Tax=Limnoglobus roseus TaxID=2598579 RepID=A0A5C1APF1_9BACT|nr:hypothetical protein [Limnoglobus roseus]QEL20880.1 hypothetical protein PX52LOC_08001 [Limnoglobus roseus]
MKAPEYCLDRLRAAGLVVSEPFVPGHIAFPDGVTVGKPNTVAGNSIDGYECHWGIDGPVVDAPCPYLHYENGQWQVTVHEYIPGPGPGDFVNSWLTPEEAITDILNYLLGSHEQMRVKLRGRAAFKERLARIEAEER